MNELQPRTKLTAPPSLARLAARRISNPTNDFETGVEVEPHDASAPVRIDPIAAWSDASCTANLLGGREVQPMPKSWESGQRISGPRSVVFMRVGHFPQMFDYRTRVVNRSESVSISTPDHSALVTGATNLPGWLTAALRSMIPAATISSLLSSQDQVKVEDRALWTNEIAAAKWDTGFSDEAIAVWQAMAHGAVRDFNLGVAFLALGRVSEAAIHFTAAITTLPPESGWVNLAGVYLALCSL